MIKLVLLRHGESTWNLENRFTGWTDVDLSPKGIEEAHEAAEQVHEEPAAGADQIQILHAGGQLRADGRQKFQVGLIKGLGQASAYRVHGPQRGVARVQHSGAFGRW